MSIQTKFDMSDNHVVPVITFPYSFPDIFQNVSVLTFIHEYKIAIYLKYIICTVFQTMSYILEVEYIR